MMRTMLPAGLPLLTFALPLAHTRMANLTSPCTGTRPPLTSS
jgi:hypothetical protein